ncbi:MAG: ferrous iron transport protein B [Nitrososphaerota archaeon]|nr:ferrous iron transport protein B [Candidatus Bathyarchaeota archaeon]MDW8024056.1 ferrous iron transport protein B [Nitrososphaerota archaeon]MDW8040551.1 ferrous iron transport protein B [Nitrososphaerota archaeon]
MTKQLRVALAGNANVGKSAIFNQLTGLNQVVGNWPGKTVERAEGTLHFKGYTIRVIDLPGTYSLSAFSMEEIISRDYIAVEKPDVIINVVDASALERNLYFTLQLLELEAPVVMALNQVDFAAKKGIRIKAEKLSEILGIPVVPTVAITGSGVNELLTTVVAVASGERKLKSLKIQFGVEIEEKVQKIQKLVEKKLPQMCNVYPARWIAIKILERDEDVAGKLKNYEKGAEVLKYAEKCAAELEKMHGEPSPVILASERYSIASKIAKEVTVTETPPRISLEQKLDAITTHKILGYPILMCVVLAMFSLIFIGGSFLSSFLESILGDVSIYIEAVLASLPQETVKIVVDGVFGGVVAGITIALPYIVPFYVILALLEDSGYLPRAAFLMDHLMHKMGLHGKAFIPLVLGYGCSVPACIGCRIMETERERLIAAFVATLIPCAARTVVILGLVGRYVGLHAALALYLFDLALVFALGRIAFKVLPGEPVGLIMEMPPYKKPTLKVVLTKTWSRTKDFVYVAFPMIVAGSLAITALNVTGFIGYVTAEAKPIISGWLGLPVEAGVPLIFGVLRKELALILLSELIPLETLSAVQMIVFALVTTFYIPCVATVAALSREFGWKKAMAITVVNIMVALILGGLAYRLLSLVVA